MTPPSSKSCSGSWTSLNRLQSCRNLKSRNGRSVSTSSRTTSRRPRRKKRSDFSIGTAGTLAFFLVNFRRATLDDCALLADLNHQLIRDEGHRNPMTVPELEQRMRGWLASEYAAVIFEEDGEVVAHVLYREQPEEIYLRQLFVARNRRRQGIGRKAVEIMRT